MFGFGDPSEMMLWWFSLCFIVLAVCGSAFCCWWMLVKAIQMLEKWNMGNFIAWAHEWYLMMLIMAFAFVLVELFIFDRVMKRPKSHWRFWMLISGWPLLLSVLFIFGAAGTWLYSWLVLFWLYSLLIVVIYPPYEACLFFVAYIKHAYFSSASLVVFPRVVPSYESMLIFLWCSTGFKCWWL